MNNLITLGDVQRVSFGQKFATSVNSLSVISSVILIISITVLILEILSKKTKFKIPIIILLALIIPLCIASIIVSINLSEYS